MSIASNISNSLDKSSESGVRILAPEGVDQHLESFFNESDALRLFIQPFSQELCEIVSELGQEILKSPILKGNTGAVALAFWLRKANVERIKAEHYEPLTANDKFFVVPVGRVFHLAPANVDTLFLYSWALSFLCGNANVVRVSSSLSPVTIGLLQCIDRVMARRPILRLHNRFMTCEHGSKAIRYCSSWCTHRVIWGGDEAIAQIRPIPIPTHASERVFASKHSYAVFSSDQVLNESETTINKVSEALFNDIFQFNQNACSSPHTVFWVGDHNDMGLAIQKLENALCRVIKIRDHNSTVSDVVQRFSQACSLAAGMPSKVNWHEGFFTSIEQDSFKHDETRGFCGGGFVRHLPIGSIDELFNYASSTDQTITYYGLSDHQLQEIAEKCGSRGVDRVVPVGQALDFSPVWDGFDLVGDFIRRVHVQRG